MTLAEKYKEMFVEGREEGRVEGRKEGRAEGKAEGLAEGEERGMAKGEAKAKSTLIASLQRNGLSIAEIAKLAEMPEHEVAEILQSAGVKQ